MQAAEADIIGIVSGTNGTASLPLGVFPPELSIPTPAEDSAPVEYAEALGEAHLAFSRHRHRKDGGHYLTPSAVARYMADCSAYPESHVRVLDPGSGTGILAAAACESAADSKTVTSLHVDAYETHPLLADLSRLALVHTGKWLAQRGVALTFNVRNGDFVLENAVAPRLNGQRHRRMKEATDRYDLIISNPPYLKIGKDDPRAAAWGSVVHGQPNIYALFMAVSAELLSDSGRLVYIVPRSFASGLYFRKFREVFFHRVTPTAVHLFESRRDVFRSQTVLQENMVLTARRRMEEESPGGGQILVSHSHGASDLPHRTSFLVDSSSVLDMESENRELSIPTCPQDLQLVRAVRSWPNTLHSIGLDISTGPVVPFRSTKFLTQAPNGDSAAPLLWMQHVRSMRTTWPLTACDKPQWIDVCPESTKVLVADETYVLLRRFSAKEEKHRLVAAPLLQGALGAAMVGLENHLNYIRGVSRPLEEELAYGLAALFNSTFLDRYFRISSGNTQVSATELRSMPLPTETQIRLMGAEVKATCDSGDDLLYLDEMVADVLNLSPEICAGMELSGR